ncbi:MAG: flavodoxin family protein [Patescibacteria group bacterium]|jgi:flavodoxin
MKTLIVNISIAHQNTLNVAKNMARVFDCKIKKPNEININDLKKYDLIGFGSGIYFMKHHVSLLNLVEKCDDMKGKKAFIFSTSGFNSKVVVRKMHKALKEKLQAKNFEIIGEFNCPGLDTWGPYKYMGGLNKNRPNERDFKNAILFAKELVKKF